MSELSIKAEGLSKEYIIGGAEVQYDSFRDMLANAFVSPFRKFKRLSGDVAEESRFWALNDINFEINRGDVVGVIGHNGAGKSTLLKVLSRITAPTTGRVEIHGRVASLLEVGTGFHPELTGRENIYLNGSILGMRRSQIDRKFDEIVDFAGVEKFLDTPVKRYSSGMYVRLAFSVAASLDTDVLLVDEVLAVGDQKFQSKCLGKLGDVSSEGRTVLFVSHNLSSVSRLCKNALVLDQGKVVFNGNVSAGISAYNNQVKEAPVLSHEDFKGNLYPQVVFKDISLNSADFVENIEVDPLSETVFVVRGYSSISIERFRTMLTVQKDGQIIFRIFDGKDLTSLSQGFFESLFRVPEKLFLPGEYTFSIGAVTDVSDQWVWTRAFRFIVLHNDRIDYDSSEINCGVINIDGFGERHDILEY